MSLVRQVFCTLECAFNEDGVFVPKGTKVQLVQIVDFVSSNFTYKKIRVRCSDYLSSEFLEQVPPDCGHATSGDPIFFDVEPTWLIYHSTEVIKS